MASRALLPPLLALLVACGGPKEPRGPSNSRSAPPTPDLFTFVQAVGDGKRSALGFALNTSGIDDGGRLASALAALFRARLVRAFPEGATASASSIGVRGTVRGSAPVDALVSTLLDELDRPVDAAEIAPLTGSTRSRIEDPCLPRPTSERAASRDELEGARARARSAGRVAVALYGSRERESAAREVLRGRRFFGVRSRARREGVASEARSEALSIVATGPAARLRATYDGFVAGPLGRRLELEGAVGRATLDYAEDGACLSIGLDTVLGVPDALSTAARLVRSFHADTEISFDSRDPKDTVEDLAAFGLVGRVAEGRPELRVAPRIREAPPPPVAPSRSTASGVTFAIPCALPWFERASHDQALVALSLASERAGRAYGMKLQATPTASEGGSLGLHVDGEGRGASYGRALADVFLGTEVRRKDVEHAEALISAREREWSPLFRELVRLERKGRPVTSSPGDVNETLRRFARGPLIVSGTFDDATLHALADWLPSRTDDRCPDAPHAPIRGLSTFEGNQESVLVAFEAELGGRELDSLARIANAILSKALGPLATSLSVRGIGRPPSARLVVEASGDGPAPALLTQIRWTFEKVRRGELAEAALRDALARAGADRDGSTRERWLASFERNLDEGRAVLLMSRKPIAEKEKASDKRPGKAK